MLGVSGKGGVCCNGLKKLTNSFLQSTGEKKNPTTTKIADIPYVLSRAVLIHRGTHN